MIGSRIRKIRNLHNLSQQGLSNLTLISKGRLGRIEREEVSITFNELSIIARSLNVSIYDIINPKPQTTP